MEKINSLSELVSYLSVFIDMKGLKLPIILHPCWHFLFYELKNQQIAGKPEFLDQLVFTEVDYHPFSNELKSTFVSLVIDEFYVHPPTLDFTVAPSRLSAELYQNKYKNLDDSSKAYLDAALKIAFKYFKDKKEQLDFYD